MRLTRVLLVLAYIIVACPAAVIAAGIDLNSDTLVTGNLQVTGTISGNGAGLTNTLAQLPLSDCGTISQSGSYYLTQSLTYAFTSGRCLIIDADNVSIDFMGYEVVGQGKAAGSPDGIFIANARSYVEVRNGGVRDFGGSGIAEQGPPYGKSNRIVNMKVASNGAFGVFLGSAGSLVEGSTFEGNYTGVFTSGGSNFISRNFASNNETDGVRFNCSSVGGIVVSNNNISANSGNGILVDGGCFGTIVGNLVAGNSLKGIYISSGVVRGNTVINNQMEGIETTGASLVRDNFVANSQKDGIKGNGLISDNVVSGNNVSADADSSGIAGGGNILNNVSWFNSTANITVGGQTRLESNNAAATGLGGSGIVFLSPWVPYVNNLTGGNYSGTSSWDDGGNH
jgi:hypothetical protein